MKIPHTPFWKTILLFEDSLLGYSRNLFQKECLRGQCQFLCFWKPMSKDYGFIKSSKGKTLINPLWSRQSVDARPWSEWKTAVMGLRSTTRCGDAPTYARPIGSPSQWLCVWSARCFECSLFRWKKVYVYLWRCGRNLGQILTKGKWSHHQSLGFSGHLFLVDFITDPRLRKRAFFLI